MKVTLVAVVIDVLEGGDGPPEAGVEAVELEAFGFLHRTTFYFLRFLELQPFALLMVMMMMIIIIIIMTSDIDDDDYYHYYYHDL